MAKSKVVLIIFLALLTISCDKSLKTKSYHDFVIDGYDIVFGSTYLGGEYNFVNDTLKGGYLNKVVFKDTMQLKQKDKETIARLFYQNRLSDNEFYEGRDYINLIGKNLIFPENDDQIKIYRDKKLLLTIKINRNYQSDNLFYNKNEKEIVEFRDLVWSILEKQKKYQIMLDSIEQIGKRNPALFL